MWHGHVHRLTMHPLTDDGRPILRATVIRIEWKIGRATGGGLWFIASASRRKRFASAVAFMNREHGAGTHWIAERPLADDEGDG